MAGRSVLQAPAVPSLENQLVAIHAKSLEFLGTHEVVTDYEADWGHGGEKYPKPQFRRGGRLTLISQTKGTRLKVRLRLALAVGTELLGGFVLGLTTGPLTVTVKAQNDHPWFAFGIAVPASAQVPGEVELEAEEPLPDRIDFYENVFFDWEFTFGSTTFKDSTGPHFIAATYAAPRPVSEPRDEITSKRLRAAAKLASKAVDVIEPKRRNEPHEIVRMLMRNFPNYATLPDPAVPAGFNHPEFIAREDIHNILLNTGVWPLMDYIQSSAECQAIVRFISGILKMLGVPGKTETVVIFTHPSKDHGNEVQELLLEEYRRHPGKYAPRHKTEKWHSILFDRPVIEGTIVTDVIARANNYEACLKFDDGALVLYYGGGAGIYDRKECVMTAFYALVWAEDAALRDPDTHQIITEMWKIQEVVRRYQEKWPPDGKPCKHYE